MPVKHVKHVADMLCRVILHFSALRQIKPLVDLLKAGGGVVKAPDAVQNKAPVASSSKRGSRSATQTSYNDQCSARIS